MKPLLDRRVPKRWHGIAIALLITSDTACVAQPQTADPEATNQYGPLPPVVVPALTPGDPASDARVLFDGNSLMAWQLADGKAPDWRIVDGQLHAADSTEDLVTRQLFGDFQLHLEWRAASRSDYERALETANGRTILERVKPSYLSQYAANSGVFLQDRYEIQVLETYGADTYVNGLAGSLYKQQPPLVQALRPPGDWQHYDIIWQAPRFGDTDRVIVPAHVTLLVNGVLVLNHAPVTGATRWRGLPVYERHGKAPLRLQNHHTIAPVYYRNIWIREL